MPQYPFAEYRPDVADIDTGFTRNINNVIAAGQSYRPLKSMNTFSSALTARCQGAVSAFALSGVSSTFAGDASKLYLLESATFSDKSKVGGYATVATDRWDFDVFGSRLIAVNGTDTPQKWTLASSTIFADLAGTPPVAKYVAVVRDFVFMGNISGAANRVKWSGFNDSEGWTVGTNQCNQQDFPTGGSVQGIVGGEMVYVFLRTAIYAGAYVGGETIFQFDELENGHGCLARGGIVRAGDITYFIDRTGFYSLAGGQIQAIGKERVDRTFLSDLNQSYLERISGCYDWVNGVVVWGYPSLASSTGVIDKLLIYNPAEQRWTPADVSAEIVFMSLQAGYTLDGLTALGYTLDTLPASLDSSLWKGGALQLAAFDTAHKLAHFSGAPLQARVATAEIQPVQGGRAYVDKGIPMIDASAATLNVGTRERYADSVAYGDESAMTVHGTCGVNRSGRSITGRVTIPAGELWTHASGLILDVTPAGNI